jgi:hypothetical protein
MAGSLRVLRDMTTKAAFLDESGRKRTKADESAAFCHQQSRQTYSGVRLWPD